MKNIYSRLFIVDVVDNICNLDLGFMSFHILFQISDNYLSFGLPRTYVVLKR